MKRVYLNPQTQSVELITESKICSMSNNVGVQTGGGTGNGGSARIITRRVWDKLIIN